MPRLMILALLLIPTMIPSISRAQDVRAKPRKFALVIAVDRYRKGSMLPPLPFPERDADGLAQVLIDSGYDKDRVVVMTRTRGANAPELFPTAENIREQFSLMVRDLKPLDSVMVALAGHGVLMKVQKEGEKEPKSESYFCPMDADLTKKGTDRFVAFSELYDGLVKSKAGTKILLVDACRNELLAAPEGRPGGIDLPPPPPPPPSVAALFSCSEQEVAWENRDLDGGHGVFFHFVIQGLKGKADEEAGNRDRKVTLSELTSYVQDKVPEFVAKQYAKRQMPQLLGNLGRITLLDLGRAEPVSFAESIGIKMVPIPSGEFLMGTTPEQVAQILGLYPDVKKEYFDDEQPRHVVKITQLQAMSAFEITVGQFRRFVNDDNYKTDAEKDGKGGWGLGDDGKTFKQDPKYTWSDPGFPQSDDHPVTNVSWNDARAFCAWLSRKDSRSYRLSTEAEWEYCCRAGSDSLYTNGDDPERLALVGNVADASAKRRFPSWTTIAGDDGYVFTSPVGKFAPNGFGLFDMHGNVCEWCADGYDAKQYQRSAATNPQGPESASSRVYRGGCWGRNGRRCRSAYRDWSDPTSRFNDLGFRVARVPSGS